MTPEKHRRASIALGVATAVIGLLGVVTGVSDSSGGPILAGPSEPPPPPPAVVTVSAGATNIPVVSSTPTVPAPGGAPGVAAPINPIIPVDVTVADGKLLGVALTDSKSGKPMAGTLSADGLSWHSTGRLAY